MNIFVANLNYSISEEDIRDAFSQFGAIDSVKLITDRDTGRSKGFGFVEMPNDDEARRAIEALNQLEMAGRAIIVKESEPRNRDRRGGGGFRDRRGGGGGGYRR